MMSSTTRGKRLNAGSRKLLWVLLVLTLSALCLVSCGKKGSDVEYTPPPATVIRASEGQPTAPATSTSTQRPVPPTRPQPPTAAPQETAYPYPFPQPVGTPRDTPTPFVYPSPTE